MILIIYLLRVPLEDLSTKSRVLMHSRQAHSHVPRNERQFFADVH